MSSDRQRYERALAALGRGDHAGAARALRGLVARSPGVALYHALLADQYHQQDLYAPAIDHYRRALFLQAAQGGPDRLPCGCRGPDEAMLRAALASALVGAGLRDEAAFHFRRAVDLDPRPDRWVALGHHLEDDGLRRQARRCYVEALRLDAGAPDALASLAQLQVWRSPARASRWFRRALDRAPDHPEALTGLGYCLLVLRRLDDAEATLRRAARVDSTARPLVYLAHAAEARGRQDRARELHERAVARDPGDAHPLFALGDHHRRHGDAEAAREAYLHALRLAPRCADTALRLGLLHHERLGDDLEAAVWIRRGLALAPFHPWRGWLERDVLPRLARDRRAADPARSQKPGPP